MGPFRHARGVTPSHLPVRVLRPSGARPGPTVVATETGDGRSPLATIAPRGGAETCLPRWGRCRRGRRKGFLRRGRGEETKFRRAEPRGIFLSRAVTRLLTNPGFRAMLGASETQRSGRMLV